MRENPVYNNGIDITPAQLGGAHRGLIAACVGCGQPGIHVGTNPVTNLSRARVQTKAQILIGKRVLQGGNQPDAELLSGLVCLTHLKARQFRCGKNRTAAVGVQDERPEAFAVIGIQAL